MTWAGNSLSLPLSLIISDSSVVFGRREVISSWRPANLLFSYVVDYSYRVIINPFSSTSSRQIGDHWWVAGAREEAKTTNFTSFLLLCPECKCIFDLPPHHSLSKACSCVHRRTLFYRFFVSLVHSVVFASRCICMWTRLQGEEEERKRKLQSPSQVTCFIFLSIMQLM